MKRPRKLFGVPKYHEMRVSGYIVRQRIGSNVVTISREDGSKLSVSAHLTAGNVRQIIIESGA